MSEFHCRANCNPPPVGDILGASIDPVIAERGGHWLKALQGNVASKRWCEARKIRLRSAAAEGVPDSGGGFLVEPDFDAEILQITETYGTFRANCDVRPTTSDLLQRPRRVGGLTAYWTAEGASITETSMSWDSLEASPRKLAILGRCSAELFMDSAADVGSYIATEISYAFAAGEDAAGFLGDGSATYCGQTGLQTKLTGTAGAIAASTGSAAAWTAVTATDIGNLVASVQASAIPDSAFYMNKKAYGAIVVRLAGTAGGLVASVGAGGQINASWLGFPIRFSASIPEVAGSNLPIMFFGSLRRSAQMAERRQTIIRIAWQSPNTFETDQRLIRGSERLAIIVHDTTDGSAGSMSMLVGTT